MPGAARLRAHDALAGRRTTAPDRVILVLGWIWGTGESDGTSLETDWGLLALTVATPLVVGAAALFGRRVRGVLPASDGRTLSTVVQRVTEVLFVVSATVAPLAVLGALFEVG